MKIESNPTPADEATQYADFDIRVFYEALRQRAWLIVVFSFAGLLLGGGYVAYRSSVFEASATVQVQAENPSVLSTTDVATKDQEYNQPEDLKTVELQLCAGGLIWRVIQSNKLDQKPDYFKPGLLRSILGMRFSQADMIRAFLKQVEVKARKGTRLIDITIGQKEDPIMAQALVRSLIDEFAKQNAEWRVNPSKEGDKFLVGEAERLKKNLETAEQALQEYREKNHAVSLEEKQNIVVERLKDLNSRVAKAQNDTLAIESDLAQLDKIGRQPERLLSIGSIANAQSVLDVRKVLTDKEAAFAVLGQRYGPENPAYSQAERQLRQVRATLETTVLNAADSLRTQFESAKQSLQMAEKMLKEQEEVALDLNRKAVEYGALSREVVSDRALFDALVNRIKEAAVSKHFNEINLRVVDPPILGDPPTLLKRLLCVFLGIFGGGALGFGVVIARYVARPTVQLSDQAEQVLGLPVFGAIPYASGLKGDASQIPCIKQPRSQAAEAFRFLVASVSAMLGEAGKRIVVFTSAAKGDGNTSCSTSYAVALAQTGVRTLLIDADLRNPTIGRLFSIPKDTSGLAECLAGRSQMETSVVPTKVENLFVLVAGAVPPDISGLLCGAALGELIGKAVKEYGQVVIDSAPVNIASETLLLARHVSGACIVLRSGRTSISAASRACRLLGQMGRMPIGFILNQVPRRTMMQ